MTSPTAGAVRQFSECSLLADDGTELAYRSREGDTSGASPLLAIPGLGMPAEIWFPTLNALDPGRSVVVIEPRGSGKSGDIITAVDGKTFATDIVAIMDNLQWDSAHITGISMGAMIAQHVQVLHPARVLSLALVCSYAKPGPWTTAIWELRLRLQELGDVTAARQLAALVLTGPAALEANPSAIDQLMQIWSNTTERRSSYTSQMQFCASHDLYDELGKFKVPSLVVSGLLDLLCPTATSNVLADLLSARLVEFPSASHILSAQQPQDLARILDQHISAVDDADSTFRERKITS